MSSVYLRLTPSQLMGLRSLVGEYVIGAQPRSEVFVDCSVQPSVDTTPEELLSVLLNDPVLDDARYDPEDPRLYDAARLATHEAGMPWTDPRTGITYEPPPHGVEVRPATMGEQRAAILVWAQQAYLTGAGHDCEEWRYGIRCAVCGTVIPEA